MKTESAYKPLTEVENDFLKCVATNVAMLVSNSDKYVSAAKKKKHFRKKLTEFAKKWKMFDSAYKAFCEDNWLPLLKKPINPLGTIWPGVYGREWEAPTDPRRSSIGGRFRLPRYGGTQPLGDYTLLGVIHDKVPTNCPSISNGILPDELIELIWENIITGVGIEDQIAMSGRRPSPRAMIDKDKINGCLSRITSDIEMLSKEIKNKSAMGLGSGGITPPITRDSVLTGQQKSEEAKQEIADESQPEQKQPASCVNAGDVNKPQKKEELPQKPKPKKQPWRDDAPDYMENSEAIVEFTENKMALSRLTKLLNRPDNTIRFMRKGRRGKVHIGDFRNYARQHYIGDKLADEIADERLAQREFRQAEEDCHKSKTGK